MKNNKLAVLSAMQELESFIWSLQERYDLDFVTILGLIESASFHAKMQAHEVSSVK